MILEKLKANYGEKRILMTSSDKTGCSLLRVVYPYNFLKDSFTTIELSEGFPINHPITHESDVVWLQRPNHEYFTTYIPEMQRQGKAVIIDMDDMLWDIPATNLAHRHYPPKELRKVDAVLKLCDCFTTSTKPLADFLENKFQKKAFILPNHVWASELSENSGEKVKNEKIKIGWAGSYTHRGDFDHHLIDVLRGLPYDKVDFYAMGDFPSFFKPYAKEIPWCETKDFHKTFASQNWDIGIMVAKDHLFNTVKSNLKYIEYGSIKCAPIGHAVYPYVNCIEDGVDGLLVYNTKVDWKKHIYRLIEDEEYRLSIANNAYNKVNKEYTFEGDSQRLEDKYLEVFDYAFGNR